MVNYSTGLISSVLETNGADVFLRSNGNQVTSSELEGKIVGLYFASSSSEICQAFTPQLIDIYNELISLKMILK
ncbi:hypothetical protein LWI28_010425 [Acer negundo]|uniref:Uncharacterized protein n=1 Tax=Acer negundo TaxID=4023 RepID=A0AAD5NZG4_ACENE|nr:hypothetical protein LWI28_010425 [Acer negundo]